MVQNQDYPDRENETNADKLNRLLDKYYRGDVLELADKYPSEKESLYIEYKDLYRVSNEMAEDYLNHHGTVHEWLQEALSNYDLPVDRNLSGAHVRVTDTEGYINRIGVGELKSRHIGDFIALSAQIGQVTGAMSKIDEAAFECQRCGVLTHVEQSLHAYQEPHECMGCERQGPFQLNYDQTEFIDVRKVRFEQPPENQVNGSAEDIVGYCRHDLVDVGGENGLQDRAGQRVTVLGRVEIDDSDLQGRGNKEPIVDKFVMCESFVFDEDDEDEIDVDEHREAVNEYANRPDAIDVFRKSIDPGLTLTDEWELATEMITAYLFSAPRINPDDGDMVRGDIHMLFVSDPGMRKSMMAEKVAEISPQCELRDAGGMSSTVGLTSSASQDDFGDGQWTLSPGALPRANGGHLVLDEVDKGPELGGIHGALEGDQKLKVNKADIQANLATRVGFLALGNPVEGRFDEYEPIAEQIDLDPALMSRFDLIVTMSDKPDREMDSNIASGVLESIDESARLEYGELEAEEAETVTPDVPREVMQAWVKISRDEINPLLSDEAKEVLREFYVDTRQLNGEDADQPPATARTLVAGYRISAAFARCELSETIEARHAKRAVNISKTVVGQNFDPETGDFDANRTTETPSSQEERIKAVVAATQDSVEVPEIAEETGLDEETVMHRIKKLKKQGQMIEPESDVFRATVRPGEI